MSRFLRYYLSSPLKSQSLDKYHIFQRGCPPHSVPQRASACFGVPLSYSRDASHKERYSFQKYYSYKAQYCRIKVIAIRKQTIAKHKEIVLLYHSPPSHPPSAVYIPSANVSDWSASMETGSPASIAALKLAHSSLSTP